MVISFSFFFFVETKRGSFLSRGDSVLAKLAKLTGPSKENVLAGAKHSGNFVFTAVSPTKKESQTDEHDTKVWTSF